MRGARLEADHPDNGVTFPRLFTVSHAPAFVACLDDVAVVREAIEECGVILASSKTPGHSPKLRLVAIPMPVRPRP